MRRWKVQDKQEGAAEVKERGRGGGSAPLWLWLSEAILCAAGTCGSGGWCGRVYAKLWSPVCGVVG
jgi:hypothetical protein